MKLILPLFLLLFGCTGAETSAQASNTPDFRPDSDLLLAQFDCKTDVDDLHTAAAFATLLNHADFTGVRYHAVAGTYGMQNGLYVPAEALFEQAFPGNWSDAHGDWDAALKDVAILARHTLDSGGDIWISEAGQSDFSADLVKKLKEAIPGLDSRERIHIVQHSNWNEEVTSSDALQYVKEHTDYHKIPDGNAVGNGSPGFRSDTPIPWERYVTSSPLQEVWNTAIDLGNRYNGEDNRYLNASIAKGGLDFSDLSETCYILGVSGVKDGLEFFQRFGS